MGNALLEPGADSPPGVFRNIPGLLLGQTGQNGEKQFSRSLHRIDSLFFKNHRNSKAFQMSGIMEAVPGVPGKTADGFGKHQVYFSRFTGCNHASEACPFARPSPGNSFIRENPCQLVLFFSINIFRVVGDLVGKRAQLLFLFCGYPAVGRHSVFRIIGLFRV